MGYVRQSGIPREFGGIMRGLRTIPVLLEMGRLMEEVCPDVLHLNYVNPMAMNC
jgi:alpha-galactosidase